MESVLQRVSFFALVQLLEGYYKPHARVGELGPAQSEVLRFRGEPSLTFPTRDVQAVEEIQQAVGPAYEVTANFLGLLGTVSPLPAFYSEQILQHDDAENAQRRLFDLFHHRLLSFFYRAGTKYRYQFGFREDCSDPTSQRLLAVAGLASKHWEPDEIRPAFLLRYAGLLFQKPRSASVLQTALADFLSGITVSVTQCVPRWVPLPSSQRLLLGRSNAGLGTSAILGKHIRTCGSAFRISMGPMPYRLFIQYLPRCPKLRDLIRFTRLFLTDPLDFELDLKVLEEEIPRMAMASTPQPAMGSRLGWTSWLINRVVESPCSARCRTLIIPASAIRHSA